MLLLSSSLSIPLDVLNNRHEPVARFDARLLHLHGEWATIAVPTHASLALVHWGSLVRFWVSEGAQGYEAQGVVTARDVEQDTIVDAGTPAADLPESGDSGTLPAIRAEPQTAMRLIVVRLWQCSPFSERRAGPRRWTRFGVRLRALAPNVSPAAEDLNAHAPRDPLCWEHAWAIDISGGGMRLRGDACLPVRQRLALQFWLPDIIETRAASHARCFALCGLVLRSAPARSRAASAFDSMICFERLSPEDGFALSRFLTATIAPDKPALP